MIETTPNRIADDLLRPLLHTSRRFYLVVAFLGAIVLAGVVGVLLDELGRGGRFGAPATADAGLPSDA
jgi:hypothetical protein